MEPQTAEQVRAERARRHQQLAALAAQGATGQAAHLQRDYHARDMFNLADDIYRGANGEGQPPVGWARASEHPDLLASYGFTKQQVKDILYPRGSGFRAEVYIPDASVLGPDAKPVLVFKGSTGMIKDPDAPGGHRSTSVEDYAAANLPQAMGLETDYYNRAMKAGIELERRMGKAGFEIAAHSLGGGMATAAAAVSGANATVINPAGLHPHTAARYASQHPGVRVHDVTHTVDIYQVKGEVLLSAQTGLPQERVHPRLVQQLGTLGEVLNAPGLREPVVAALTRSITAGSAVSGLESLADMREGLAALGQHGSRDALLHPPQPQGTMRGLLEPKMLSQGQIVDRPERKSLPELARILGPSVLAETSSALNAARTGLAVGRAAQATVHAGGDIAKTTAAIAGRGMQAAAAGVASAADASCKIVSVQSRRGGEFSAQAVVTAANATAAAVKISGRLNGAVLHGTASVLQWGANHLPEGSGRHWVGAAAAGFEGQAGRQRAGAGAAAQAVQGQAQRAGQQLRAGSANIGAEYCYRAKEVQQASLSAGFRASNALNIQVQAGARHADKAMEFAPARGAMAGVAIAGAAQAFNPDTYTRAIAIVAAAKLTRAGAAAEEAVARHGVGGSATPSLDFRIRQQESRARDYSRANPGAAHPPLGQPSTAAPRIDDPRHHQHALFKQAQAGVHGVDAKMGRVPDAASDRIAGALAAGAYAAGLSRIHAVEINAERTRMFAADSGRDNAHHRMIVSTDIALAVNQTLATSTERIDQMQQQRGQQQAQATATQMTQQASVQGAGVQRAMMR